MSVDFSNLTQFLQPLLALKIVFLLIIAFFIVFTFVVVNQVNTMNKIVSEAHSSFTLKLIAILNLLLAVSLFLLALAIL